MKICVALLRGINVGGKNPLPMNELVAILEGIGAQNVKTYVQSGNAVFKSSQRNLGTLSRKLADEIESGHGFRPQVLILGLDAIQKAAKQNPFPEAESDPRSLHLGFLGSVPKKPDLDKVEDLRKKTERVRLIDSVFYLHAPEGIGRSKLAANAEDILGVTMTYRNWRTVCKIQELAGK